MSLLFSDHKNSLKSIGSTPSSAARESRRILIIDDNEAIHEDFSKILRKRPADTEALDELEASLFGSEAQTVAQEGFVLDMAFQGQEGLEMVKRALDEGDPYAMAFVDVRMPPGWDGIETTERLWRVDPDLQVVLCTAYSDYSWEQMAERLGYSERLFVLKKPFDKIEVRQFAFGLREKWALLQERRAHKEALEELVQARTSDLEETNRRLRSEMAERNRAERELRHTHRLKALGHMSAAIGHEINNPLCSIMINAEFVLRELKMFEGVEDDDLDECAEALEEAVLSATRIKRIVNAIRGFARKEERSVGPVSLQRVMEGALRMISTPLRHKARVVKHYGKAHAALVEEGAMEQVFVNLLVNALEALPDDGSDNTIVVTISTRRGMIEVEIRDNGHGISKEHLEKVMDPFFTTRPAGKGTGMGLSISHQIIASFGGQLTLESEKGKGTTARILVPSHNSTEQHLALGRKGGDRVIREQCPLLVVDDDPSVLMAMWRALDGVYEVDTASSAEGALAMCRRRSYSLVLCDLMMPDKDGADFHHELTGELPAYTDKLLFVTAGAFNEKLITFMDRSEVPVLNKPFSKGELKDFIEQHLDLR